MQAEHGVLPAVLPFSRQWRGEFCRAAL